MYLTVKQQLKHLDKSQYKILKELCHTAKNLTNEALYNIRQQFFEDGSYLSYVKNYDQIKINSKNYRILNTNMGQQILKEVDGSFKSFFALLKKAKAGEYDYKDIHIPHYLPKDGYAPLVIGFVRINDNRFVVPYSHQYRRTHSPIEIRIPPILMGKKIKEIRITPKSNARFFEVQYTHEVECAPGKYNINHALALDPGVNNLVAAVTSTGKSFLIDGRYLKSVNQWYNKENARLQSIKDKQGFGSSCTKRQDCLLKKRNNRINDYLSKTARYLINYCMDNDIGTIVFGYNKDFQRNAAMGKANNQTFVSIPFGKLKDKLQYLCKFYGIRFVEQEESYTSEASFWDNDEIPVYGTGTSNQYVFSGKRIKRGLYKTSTGKRINADINGALNILRKSKAVSLEGLRNRGDVDTPVRIRMA